MLVWFKNMRRKRNDWEARDATPHVGLEAALETSDKWQVADASLSRWHNKLKCAAQECDDTLHICKQ
jgi:hypothetical protein